MSLYWRAIDKSKLHPGFVDDLEKLFAESKWDWYVTFGYRSIEQQADLYAKYLAGGPKAAPPGKSAHNFGLAVDVVLDKDPNKPGLQPSWDLKLAAWIWLLAKCLAHPRLQSGFKFGDANHIQVYKWPKYI